MRYLPENPENPEDPVKKIVRVGGSNFGKEISPTRGEPYDFRSYKAGGFTVLYRDVSDWTMMFKAKVSILCIGGSGNRFGNSPGDAPTAVRQILAGAGIATDDVAMRNCIQRLWTIIGSGKPVFGFGFRCQGTNVWVAQDVWFPDGKADFFRSYTDVAVACTRRFITEVFKDTFHA